MSLLRENMMRWCDTAIVCSFYAFIYFSPISTALCESFAGATLFFFLLKRTILYVENVCTFDRKGQRPSLKLLLAHIRVFLKSYKPKQTPLSRPIGVYVLICFLSVLISQDMMLSFSGFVFKILQGAYLYFAFIESFNKRKQIHIFTALFCVSTLLISVNGIVQYLRGTGFIYGHQFAGYRINSCFHQANDFGAYLVIVIPAIFCMFFFFFGRKATITAGHYRLINFFRNILTLRILSAGLLAVTLLCLGLTYSRGAWVGLAFALSFVAIRMKKMFILCFLVIVIFFSFFYPKLQSYRPNVLSEQQEGMFSDIGGSGRIGMWKEIAAMIRTAPALGFGLNTYSRVAPEHEIDLNGYAHNCYLQMTVEIGLLGLFSFLWIIKVLFFQALRNMRLMKDDFLKFLLAGFLAGFLGFLAHSFFDTSFYSVQLGNLMWVIMGVIVAIQNIEIQEKQKEGATI